VRTFMIRYWWISAAVAAAVIILAVAVLWPSRPSVALSDPPTAQRSFASWRACLVTGPDGLADSAVGPAWSGLQDASAKTSVQVTYLAATNDATAGGAATYVASLAGANCGIVVAVGAAQTAGVALVAAKFPQQRFVDVGSGTSATNVRVLSGLSSAQVRAAVATEVEQAYEG